MKMPQEWKWCERWRRKHFKWSANSLFRSTWFHIRWWRRWGGGAPAMRAGCSAAAPSPWWPRWPGTELFRQGHVSKPSGRGRGQTLCARTSIQPATNQPVCAAWSKFQLQCKQCHPRQWNKVSIIDDKSVQLIPTVSSRPLSPWWHRQEEGGVHLKPVLCAPIISGSLHDSF